MSTHRLTTIGRIALTIPLLVPTAPKAAEPAAGLSRFEVAQLVSPEEAARRKKEAEERAKRGGQGGQPGQQRPPEGRRSPPPGQPPGNAPQRTAPPPRNPSAGNSPFLEKRIVPPANRTTTPVPPSPNPATGLPPKVAPYVAPKAAAPVMPPKVAPYVTPKATEGKPAPAAVLPPRVAPNVMPKAPEGVRVAPSATGPASTVPSQFQRTAKPIIPPPRIEAVQQSRQTRVEAGGQRTVIREAGNRTIVQEGNRAFIRHDETERFRRLNNARTLQRPGGITETFYVRPDGVRVITEVDRNGHLLRRYRRGPDGREHYLVDNRRFWRNAGIAVGIGAVGTLIALNLRPPTVTIPRERYIVEYDRVNDDEIYDTLVAPPVEMLDRVYSLEEVRGSWELRQRMRRVDLDSINFDFGVSEVGPDQYGKLERLAKAIHRVLRDNPDSVFLIEGHTDAVGNEVDNLSLSDRRAQSVAQILTENFGIPPENLVTQGYGEQHLKVDTREAERANRRVSVRNVTALMAERR